MAITFDPIPVPLHMDHLGTIRVGDTRVTLDTILARHKQGDSAEAIARGFPTVSVADIHAVLAYYLRHTAEIDAYLHAREQRAGQIRAELRAASADDDIRRRMAARRAGREADRGAAPGRG